MKMKVKGIFGVTLLTITVTILGSCSADKNSSGFEYMPDMYRSAAIEPYVDYGEVREIEDMDLKMKLSAKVPPFGTIPFYGTDSSEVSIMLPYGRLAHTSFRSTHGLYGANLTSANEYELAAADLNPLKLTPENSEILFKKGKDLFMSNCAHCHGEKGDGNGPMVVSGAYAGVPDYNNLKELGDGQLFYSIYYGKGMMGAHGPILNKKEIWTLVHYIRKFQNADYGTANVVTEIVGDELVVDAK
jgi:mono/diheme cytochrome c family protein